jgi:CxxC motif-containing protein (DUF1111 family)
MAQGGCGHAATQIEDDGSLVRAVTAYIAALPPPASLDQSLSEPAGSALFASIGCAACHTPALPGKDIAVPLYSDLLLHDLGAAMDDRVVQGDAAGKEWRTTPLWGLRERGRFLHDGRATRITDAILAHDGEAAASVKAFRQLDRDQHAALLAFLSRI